MSVLHKTKLAGAIATALLATTAPLSLHVNAQALSSEDVEIISISRKRPESIQEVPVATTALSAKELESAGVERPADFIGLLPNVSIVDTANVGDTQVNIRGITSTRDAESTFAYVVDGVLMTNPNGFNEGLLDIAQIEVLKGPQSALYGRNAVAGAILVTTNEPSDITEGRVELGVGSQGSLRANGMLTGALSDSLRGRIVISSSETDGFYSNAFTGEDDVVDYLEDLSLKGRLLWDVNDITTVDFRAGYSSVKGGAINYNAIFALPSFATLFDQSAYFADVNEHDFVFAFNVPGVNKQKTLEFSLKADWDLEGVDVTAVAAYNDLEETLLSDGTSASFYGYELTDQCQTDRATLNNAPTAIGGADRTDLFGDFYAPFGVFQPGVEFTGVYGPFTPTACDGYQFQERSQSDLSLELKVASDDSAAALRWIAGVYFAQIDRDVVVAYGADTGAGFLQQAYVPPTGPNPTDLLFDDSFDTQVLSAFGQFEYDLNADWELALALRYDRESREVTNNVPNVTASGLNLNTYIDGEVGPINPAFNEFPDGIPGRDSSYSQLQPKVTLSYALNEYINTYASYGVGFRSGGFNSIGTEATLEYWFNASGEGTPGDAVDAQLKIYDEYAKEVTTSAELGVKTSWLDKALKINAAVFDTTVEDNQFFEFFAGPFGLLRAVTTIDELAIQGFELDINYTINDQWRVFSGLGLIDSEIVENKNRPLSEGNKAPQTPDKSFTFGFMYDLAIGDNWLLNWRVDYQYTGTTYFHTLQGEQTPTIWDYFGTLGGGVPPGPHYQDMSNATRDSYSTINTRVTFDSDNWVIGLWVKNLTDEQYLQEVIPTPEFGGSFAHPSALRSYGVDVTYQF